MKEMSLVRANSEDLSITFRSSFETYSVVDEAEKVAWILQGVIPSSVFDEVVKYLKAAKKNKTRFGAQFRKEYFERRRQEEDEE